MRQAKPGGGGRPEVFKAWVAFCKQNRYPHPYPYPYPKPQAGARMRQIVELVDRLLKDEKDEARKKLLQQIRAIAAGAANAFAAVTISSRASVASLSEYSTACCLNRVARHEAGPGNPLDLHEEVVSRERVHSCIRHASPPLLGDPPAA